MFYPKGMTGKVQVLDLGIIKVIKGNYRQALVLHLIGKVQNFQSAYEFAKKFDVYRVITWLLDAWNSVKETTIKNCFQKAGNIRTEAEVPVVDYLGILSQMDSRIQNEIGGHLVI